MIEKLSPYARNPRTPPTRKSLRSPSVSRAWVQNPSLVYTKAGIIAGPRAHARRAKAPAQRRSRHWSKISVPIAGFVLFGHRYRDSHDLSFPKTGARERLLSLRIQSCGPYSSGGQSCPRKLPFGDTAPNGRRRREDMRAIARRLLRLENRFRPSRRNGLLAAVKAAHSGPRRRTAAATSETRVPWRPGVPIPALAEAMFRSRDRAKKV